MAHILLIEDDDAIRGLIHKFLSIKKLECAEAQNGTEAINMLTTRKFDIVLCDLNLPDMSGNDILKFLRHHADLHDIPVIIISAYTDQNDITESLNLGANEYITKPFAYKYGSRHRAAIGISEVTDSVTVVVSEETGRISFAVNGELETVSPDAFLRAFETYMADGGSEE